MGKSRLIVEGVRLAQRLSFPVAVGAAEPSESVAELAPLLRALFDGPEPLLDRSARAASTRTRAEVLALQDLQSLLERATDRPLVIFLTTCRVDSGTVAARAPPRLASVPIG